MSTIIVKGTVTTNPYLDNISRAQFVNCVATSATQTIEVRSEDSTVLGEIYLHTAGDSVIIEKAPGDVITMAAGKVSAVGSPRS
jgi:hypothetical protein